MSLPTAVVDVLWQISQSTAYGLVAKLEQTPIGSDNATSGIAEFDAVIATMQNHPSYLEAIRVDSQGQEQRKQQVSDREAKHSAKHRDAELDPDLDQQALKKQYQYSQQVLEGLRSWQAEKIQIKLQELPQIWQQDRWIARLSQLATEHILRSQATQHRLLILAAPLKISKTCALIFHEDLTIQFADQLERFLASHYPLTTNSPTSIPAPVEFYADYFPEPISKLNLCMTQKILGLIPTAIIYTNINESQMNCHIGFWTPANLKIAFYPVPSWNWQAARTTLEASGMNPGQALIMIQEIAIAIHQVLAGFIADWYYLKITPFYKPQLFQVHEALTKHGIKNHWIQPYINCLRNIQQKQTTKMNPDKEVQYGVNQIQSFRCIRTLTGHTSWVGAVAISQDRKTLISGSYDNTIKLWDLSTGESISTLIGHNSTVYSVAMSPDRQTVISGSDDGTIKLWNSATGELTRSLRDSPSQRDAATKVQSVAMTQDGQKFVSAGDDRTVKIWQLDNGQLLHSLTGHSNKVEVVAIAPDNQTIVSGSDDGTIKMWDLETGKLNRTIEGHFKGIYSLVISPNGETIITGHSQKQIHIWHFKTGELIRTLQGNFGAVYALAINPDNKTLASADFLGESLGNQTVAIQLWDISTGQLLHTLSGHSNRIFALCFSDDGQTLISASEDKTIKIWQCD